MEFRGGDEAAMGLDEAGTAGLSATDKVAVPTLKKSGKAAIAMDRKDAGSDDLIAAAGDALLEVAKVSASLPKDDSKAIMDRRFTVVTDSSRDVELTDFGKETLTDRYLLPGESFQDLFARVADAYADDQDHAQRL